MSIRWREVAKFVAGYTFAETLGHWWLGVWGGEHLPWKIGSYVFTKDMNTVAMIAWPAACVALVWVGWLRKPSARRDTAPV